MPERSPVDIKADFDLMLTQLSPVGWESAYRLMSDLITSNRKDVTDRLEEIISVVRSNLPEYKMPLPAVLAELEGRLSLIENENNPEASYISRNLRTDLEFNLGKHAAGGNLQQTERMDLVLAQTFAGGSRALDSAVSFLYNLPAVVASKTHPMKVAATYMEAAVRDLGLNGSRIDSQGRLSTVMSAARSWPIRDIPGIHARLERVEITRMAEEDPLRQEYVKLALVIPPKGR